MTLMAFPISSLPRWRPRVSCLLILCLLVLASGVAGCKGGEDARSDAESDPAVGDVPSGRVALFGKPLAPDASLREALAHPDPLERAQHVARILEASDPESLEEIREEFERAPLMWGDLEYVLFVGWWARFDPITATAVSAFNLRQDHPRVLFESIRTWAHADPIGLVKSGWLAGTDVNLSRTGFDDEFVDALVVGWFESGKPGLEEWMQSLGDLNNVATAFGAYMRMRILRDGDEKALEWIKGSPFSAENQRRLMGGGLNLVARQNPELAVRWLSIAKEQGIDVDGFIPRIARGWAAYHPQAAMEWITTAEVDEAGREAAVWDIAKKWLRRDEEDFERWIAPRVAEAWTDPIKRQAIVFHLKKHQYRVDWTRLLKRTSEFVDPEMGQAMRVYVLARWRVMEPEVAKTWMAENPGFIAEDKIQFLDQIPREDREAMEKILAEAQQPK